MKAAIAIRLVDAVIATFFVLALAVPGLLYVTGYAQPDAAFIQYRENRRPAVIARPSWVSLGNGDFRHSLEQSFADSFPLRRALIEGYDSVVFVGFGDEPNKDVIRGRAGWLFFGLEEAAYLTGVYHPDDADLDYIAGVFRDRSAWCARHGVHYLLVFVPNKSTVYASMLPPTIRSAKPTPVDKLMPRLRAAGVDAVDLHPVLSAAAGREDVYSRGDTHWNDVGAYAGYRAIMSELAGFGIRTVLQPIDMHRRESTSTGDLLTMSGVGSIVADRQTALDYTRRAHGANAAGLAATPDAAGFTLQVTEVDDRSLKSAVIFHDSFGARLDPMLAENFRRVVFLQYVVQEFDEHLILVERPRIVIQEIVERRLAERTPLDR